MQGGIIWCPHCGKPHPLGTTVCPSSARTIDRALHRAPKPWHPLVGQTLGGRYRVTSFIGAGGMGEVLEAENHLKRAVAIKVLHAKATPEAAARLEREAALVAAIQHPNICDVYDVGRLPDGSPFLVLERLSGETLSDLMRRTTIELPRVCDIFMQILSGLQAAHGAHIIHRDLKPQNIFLVDRVGIFPLVKLVDFGLAKDISGIRAPAITKPGKLLGTVQFMSPEQLRGKLADHRSDLYAVGVMLYQALTGRHPFAGNTLADMQANILRAEPTPLAELRPGIPPEIEPVVFRALARDPEERWQSAVAFQKELLRAIPSGTLEDGEPTSTPRSSF